MPRGQLPPLADSILDVIGGTPLLEARRLVDHLGLDGRILIKLEYLSPGFSKKDRNARAMVEQARADGVLAPGQPVVELTSGNTGTGLAIACAALGHPVALVMSRGNSAERARMMVALGAEVVLVDQAPGGRPGQVTGDDLALVEERTRRLVDERDAFRADRFQLAANVEAHRETGREMWEQSDGAIDVFVDFLGSSSTFVGVASHLRSVRQDVRCHPVEPAGAAVLAGEEVSEAPHRIQGGGYAMSDLPLFDPALVTSYLAVQDGHAGEMARLVARVEGVFGGYSTGANLAAAVDRLRGPEAGSTVALVACDSGLKYLSTDLWS